jgi:hypothetical protein
LFLESLPRGGPAQEFAKEQARMALDVFIGEKVGWSWGEDRYRRLGPKFRLKTNSAGLTTEDTENTEGLVSTKQEVILNEGKAIWQNRESWEAMRRALRVRHYALRTIHRALRLRLVPLPF